MKIPLLMHHQVERFYADNKYKVHCGKLDLVYTLTDQKLIIAAVRLVQPKLSAAQSKVLLLRNLLVAKEHRGKGLARKLMTQLVSESQSDIYLFSLVHLTKFYASVGFSIPAEDAKIPIDILTLAQNYKARHRGWVLMSYTQPENNHTHK